jgi:antitoxin YefM
MVAVNYSTIRNNLKGYCDKATDDNEAIIVTRKGEKNVVIISLDQYNEFLKMQRNEQYLKKIDKAMRQVDQGRVVKKSMKELEAMASE